MDRPFEVAEELITLSRKHIYGNGYMTYCGKRITDSVLLRIMGSMIAEHVVSERQVTGLKDLLFKEARRSANAERSCRDAQWELAKTRVDYEKDKSRWWYKLCKRIF